MSTKHVFNSADGLVLKSLKGAVALNPALGLHAHSKSVYVVNSAKPKAKNFQGPHATVAVISGGGAGHEPAHAGYTGYGMLSASVSGDIFASPSAKQILQTIYLASSSGTAALQLTHDDPLEPPKDVLVIINNYTGDRLNFGLAIEKALASSNIHIESVIVADDVSLLRPASDSSSQVRKSLVGARGLGGNILVCKVLGALAARGESLHRVKSLGDAVVKNLSSVGVGLEHCHVPGRGPSVNNSMKIAEDECEIGLGLHNEPGVTRKKMEGPEILVHEMLDLIMSSKEGSRGTFIRLPHPEGNIAAADEVVLFLNNLGGISQLEMGAIVDEALEQLASLGVHPARVYCSAYMTSLNAPGFSISILNLSGTYRVLQTSSIWDSPIDILSLLDDPTDATAWIGARSHWNLRQTIQDIRPHSPELHQASLPPRETPKEPSHAGNITGGSERGIRFACESVLRQESALTEFDTVVGDGDCGETFAAGARAVLSFLEQRGSDVARMSPHELVRFIGDILEDRMGGTIGALFGIFLNAISASLKEKEYTLTLQQWGQALRAGLKALGKHTPARPGDRTLIDALEPFCTAISDGNSLEEAVEACKKGVEGTKSMQAVLGRAAYVSIPRGTEPLPPDPGAWGVLAIVEGLCNGHQSGV